MANITKFKMSNLDVALKMIVNKGVKTPLCVWGDAGIGKTSMIMDFCNKNEIGFTLTAGAQIMETGDLLGLPTITKDEKTGKNITTYARPDIMPPANPKTDKHIWILDDINRANNLILQSLLHLLQFREFGPHKLSDNTYIVLTANPEDGEYQVRDIDDAFKTRMLNIEVTFDEIYWGRWAASAQKEVTDINGIKKVVPLFNEESINFILKNPELVDGYKTHKTDDKDSEAKGRNNIRSWTIGFLTDSELGLQLAVGSSAAQIYKIFTEQFYKLMKDFSLNLIWEDKKKFLSFFKKGQDAFNFMILRRMATLNIKKVIEDGHFNDLCDVIIELKKEADKSSKNNSGTITIDALLLPVLTYYKHDMDAFMQEDNPKAIEVFKIAQDHRFDI